MFRRPRIWSVLCAVSLIAAACSEPLVAVNPSLRPNAFVSGAPTAVGEEPVDAPPEQQPVNAASPANAESAANAESPANAESKPESSSQSPAVAATSMTVPTNTVLADVPDPFEGATVGPISVGREQPPLRRFTMAFTGDNLLHSSVVRRALVNGGNQRYDFSPMFTRIKPIISAVDLAVCHVETPVAPPGEPLSTFPLFGVPAASAVGFASAGYDRCSTASNHALDRGAAGVDATIKALEDAGLAQSGMARNAAEATPQIFTVDGVKVAHLSYTYSFNGLRTPAGEPWRSNLIHVPTIIAAANDARWRGAEYVLLSLHWGNERQVELNAQQIEVGNALTASGQIDLIVGHHAHNLQGIGHVNGRWIVYGLGNVLSNMPTNSTWPAMSQDAAIVTVTVTERRNGGFTTGRPSAIPTWCDRLNGFVIRPVIADIAASVTPSSIRSQLEASLRRTRAILGDFIAA